MLLQVLPSRKAVAGASLTVLVGTETSSFRSAALIVDFTFVSLQTARVGEASNILASGLVADIRSGMLFDVLPKMIIEQGFLKPWIW